MSGKTGYKDARKKVIERKVRKLKKMHGNINKSLMFNISSLLNKEINTKKTSKTNMYLHKQTSADDMMNINGGTVVEFVIPLEPMRLTVPSFNA